MTFHVVWDWNGTLFDDLEALALSTSASSQSLGGPEVTLHAYCANYTRPLSLAYERILGRPVTTAEMVHVGSVFHETYAELKFKASLARDAHGGLSRVRSVGATQSVLTMWLHDELVPFVEHLGISHHFNHLQGQSGPNADTKASSLRTHLDMLERQLAAERNHTNTVMIGDTLDDGHAAKDNGVSCILLTTGSASRSVLQQSGWPVCDSITEALDLIPELRHN